MKYISFFLLMLFFVKSEAIEFQSVELDKAYSRSIPAFKIIDFDGDGDDDLFFSSIHFNEQRPGFAFFKNTNNYFSYEFIDEVINPYINQECDGADEYSGEIFYASTIINPESGNLINYNLGGCTLRVIEKNNQGVFEGTALYDPNLTDDSINLYGMGDFNADGKLDFVALNYPSMEFIAHIKNNVGGYDQINIDVSNYDGNPPGFGVRLPGFFIKDMNSDGYDDIIFSGQQNFVGMASFLKSDGQAFTSSSMIEDYQFSMGDIELGSLAVDDFDENGLLDFVVKRGIEIKLISQTGVGVFTETALGYEDYNLADSPYVLYVDEDQDGDRDLIFVDVYTGDTENDVVLVENVQGEFKNKSILFTSEYLITQLLTFEFEGKIQLVSIVEAPYSSSPRIAIKYEKSNGAYSPKLLDKNNLVKHSNTGAGKVAYIDIDMDGDQDVIIADEFELSQVYLFRNQGSHYIKELLIELPSQIRDIKVADINGDNLNDLIIASTSYKVDGDTKEYMLYVTSYINNSNSLQYHSSQSFSGIYNFPTINRDVMRFEDLENDGDQDLFIRRNMWLENSEGVYSDPKLTSPDTAPGFYGMLIEDLDGDNIREYVWTDGFFGPFSSSQDINISKFDEASSSFISNQGHASDERIKPGLFRLFWL